MERGVLCETSARIIFPTEKIYTEKIIKFSMYMLQVKIFLTLVDLHFALSPSYPASRVASIFPR